MAISASHPLTPNSAAPNSAAPEAGANNDQAVASVAKKSFPQSLMIDEKNIKISKWAIASGVAAVAITALAIATLQPPLILGALPLTFLFASACYDGISHNFESKRTAKHLNEMLSVSHEIELFQENNRVLLQAVKDFTLSTGDKKLENARTEAEALIKLKDQVTQNLPECIKESKEIKRVLELVERGYTDLNLALSKPPGNGGNKRQEMIPIMTSTHFVNHNLNNFASQLETTKNETTSYVQWMRKKLSI
jgi:hypothetical protein